MIRLLKVPLFEDEVFTSYLSRLARANACSSTREFCRDLGLDVMALNRGEYQEVARIAEMVQLPVSDLISNVVVAQEDKGRPALVRGISFPHRMLRRSLLRFCPHCIDDDDKDARSMPGARRYARFHWLFPQVAACPVHARRIVQVGHVRHQRFPNDFSTLVELIEDQMPALRAQSTPLEPTSFERFVVEALGLKTGHGEVLDSLELAVAITACELLGTARAHGTDAKWTDLSEDELRTSREVGFSYLRRGFEGLHALLDEIRSKGVKANIRGGQALYGRLYLALNENYSEPEFDALRGMIRDYTLRVEPILNGSDFFGKVVDSAWTSVGKLAEATGAADQTLRRILVVLGHLKDLRQSKGEQFITVAAAKETIAFLDDAIRLRDAAELLGIEPATLRRLIRDGAIPVLLADDVSPTKGWTLEDRISRSAITKMAEELKSLAVHPLADGMLSFAEVAKKCGLRHSELLELLRSRRPERVAVDPAGSGLLGLRFDWEEIDSLSPAAVTAGVDRAEFCRRTLVKPEAFAYLRKSGALIAEQDRSRSARCPTWMVSEDEYHRFDNTYVTYALLSKETGVGVKGIGARLREAGIDPAFSNKDTMQFIVRRVDLARCPELAAGSRAL